MKKLIILFCLFSLSFTAQDPYCEGWDLGYCEGWQYVKGDWAICPVTPICPIPRVYQNEYIDGYNRGFVKGKKDAKNQ